MVDLLGQPGIGWAIWYDKQMGFGLVAVTGQVVDQDILRILFGDSIINGTNE